jgi:hypothetical protein
MQMMRKADILRRFNISWTRLSLCETRIVCLGEKKTGGFLATPAEVTELQQTALTP